MLLFIGFVIFMLIIGLINISSGETDPMGKLQIQEILNSPEWQKIVKELEETEKPL